MVKKIFCSDHLSSLIILVSLLSDVSYVIQHEKDADTVLICHGSMSKQLHLSLSSIYSFLF